MDREYRDREGVEMRQLAKDIHRELGELLIRVGRIEERQIELERKSIDDYRKMKEYVRDEIDYVWNSMVNYIGNQIDKGKYPVKERTYQPSQSSDRVSVRRKDTSLPRCFTCDDFGHIGRDCPHAGTNLRICFQCKQLTTHIASQCPLKDTKDGDQRQRNYESRPYNANKRAEQIDVVDDYDVKRRRGDNYDSD